MDTVSKSEIQMRKAALELELSVARGKVHEFDEQLKRAENDVQAIFGAIQDCAYWLSRLPVNDTPVVVGNQID